ncbi:MAG: endonuclease/exonuclease/phosphatase family protein [Candidatus Puniceispirillaceae bacterium]
MTKIVSWNIQNGLGVDGKLSISRTAETIRELADADIICLQEVSKNILLPDGSFADQVSELSEQFSEYIPLFGAALDVHYVNQKQRGQYGNLILSRHAPKSIFYHPLPQPADGAKKQMPRQMIEATLEGPSGLLRVMTTHLEFHSHRQRLDQLKRIMDIEFDVYNLNQIPPAFSESGPYGQFERSQRTVLCGDFNFLSTSDEYNLVVNPSDGRAGLKDAWTTAKPNQVHAPTCGIYDHEQWAEGPHCRDFFFVCEELADCIEDISVDTETGASDHQPIVLTLDA